MLLKHVCVNCLQTLMCDEMLLILPFYEKAVLMIKLSLLNEKNQLSRKLILRPVNCKIEVKKGSLTFFLILVSSSNVLYSHTYIF